MLAGTMSQAHVRPSRPLVGLVTAVHTPFRADGSLGLFDRVRPEATP